MDISKTPATTCILSTDILMNYPEILQDAKPAEMDTPPQHSILEGTILENAEIIVPDVVVSSLSEIAAKGNTKGNTAREILRNLRKLQESSCIQQTFQLKKTEDELKRVVHILPVNQAFLDKLPWAPDPADVDAMTAIAAVEAVMIRLGLFHGDTWSGNGEFTNIAATFKCPEDVRLVTNNANVAIKARHYGIESVSFHADRHVYTGIRHVVVPQKLYDKFREEGVITALEWAEAIPDSQPFHPNETVVMFPFEQLAGYYGISEIGEVSNRSELVLKNPCHDNEYSYVATYNSHVESLIHLKHIYECKHRIPHAYPEIAALYNALYNPEITGIIVTGPPGVGKTFTITTEGTELCKAGVYSHIAVLQPGKSEIGAVPGGVQEKMKPVGANISDSLRSRAHQSDEISKLRRKSNNADNYRDPSSEGPFKRSIRERVDDITNMQEKNFIDYIPTEQAQGRSLDYQIVVVDEAQRIAVSVMKTIITRAGTGSKVAIIGDTNQLTESQAIQRDFNGLTLARSALEYSKRVVHIELNRTLRSDLVDDFNRFLMEHPEV